MKLSSKSLFAILFIAFLALSSSSCAKKGYGCPGENHKGVQFDDDGNLPAKRGKSRLFKKN